MSVLRGNTMFKLGMLGTLILTVMNGCLSKPFTEVPRNEAKVSSLNQTPPQSQLIMPPAPMQSYLKAGEVEHFTYWKHNITINYLSSKPKQMIKVNVDGAERTFQKEHTDNPRGIYWREGNLSFALKPVVWERRDGEIVPIYERTWGTNEIYFEVLVTGVGPSRREDQETEGELR